MTNQPIEATEAEEKALFRRISAARTRLMALVPFFGHLALNLKLRVAKPGENVPTAAVSPDGTLTLNYTFCAKLSDAELAGLICHEVLHPALHCWLRQGSRRIIVEGPNGEHFSLWNLCFPKGTYVTGAGPIEDVIAGSTVLSTAGKVAASQVRRHPYRGDLHKIHGLGLIPFEATPEHPVLVATRKNMTRTPVQLSEPEWLDASAIEAGRHYLVVPRVKSAIDTDVIDADVYCKHGRWGELDLPHNRKIR